MPNINYSSFHHSDKIIHFLLYFILVGWFMQLYKKINTRLFILFQAILLGIIIEYLQGMTHYRSFDWFDTIANTIGASGAFILAYSAFSDLLKRIDDWIYHYQW
jgi:glycopeptide antibiotics resistance protein